MTRLRAHRGPGRLGARWTGNLVVGPGVREIELGMGRSHGGPAYLIGLYRTRGFRSLEAIGTWGRMDGMDNEALTYRDYAAWAALPMEELARDCDLQVFRATGPGGQGVNTTDSAVRLTHRPSGISVTARESRSQWQNRQRALRKLREILERRAVPPTPRRATKPSRGSQERRLAGKHRRSEVKRLRRRPLDE